MKRSETLIPLSHDHHHGLVMALRLKKGGPASPNDNWPKEPALQRDALDEFARAELLPHFELEEEFVFPACKESSPELAAMVEALQKDHTTMRGLLTELHDPGNRDMVKLLHDFGVILEEHIRSEERTFFPALEQELREGKLDIDAQNLARRHAAYRQPPSCAT